MKFLVLAITLLSIQTMAFDCEQSYDIAKEYISQYDKNSDYKLNTYELIDVFNDVEDKLTPPNTVVKRKHLLAGFLWVIENGKVPGTFGKFSIVLSSNQLEKKLPVLNINRFILERALRASFSCDK